MNLELPSADKWVTSPLRNSIRVEIDAPAGEVWKLIANPANIFSNCCGVNKVEVKTDDSGKFAEYTIYYQSEDGGEDMPACSTMVWYEPNQGWASLDNDPQPMGFEQSLLLVTIDQRGEKSVLNWNMHYNIGNDEMLQMFITALNQSLKEEIAQLFIQKLGGKII